MKSYLVLVSCLLLVSYAKAQKELYNYSMLYYPESVWNLKPSKDVSVITFYKVKQEKRTPPEIYKFNERGQMTECVTYNDFHRPNIDRQYAYNDSGLTVSFTERRNKKFYRNTLRQYDDHKHLTLQNDYYKDSLHPINVTRNVFENGNIKETSVLNKKGTEISKYIYTWYPDGSRKELIQYKKGKLKSHIYYDCEIKQETSDKGVETGRVCKIKNFLPDSGWMEVTEMFVNGASGRVVRTFDRRGKLLNEESFATNGKLSNRVKFTYNEGNKIISRQHYRHNSETPRQVQNYGYDENKRVSSVTRLNSKGHISYRKEIEYN